MIPLDKIQRAAELIKNRVIHTPLVHSPTLSRRFGGDIYLKLENLQKTGAFKIRGASFKMLKLLPKIEAQEGVVAASAGNHAQGVALAAKNAGIPATIVMPEWVSITKQEATRAYGGKVVIFGRSVAESLKEAKRLSRKGMAFIHPYDDNDIITGQGTVGLEIFETIKNPDLIVVPVGGGGFISGIASVAASLNPDTQVTGVQTAAFPSAYTSVLKNRIYPVEGRSSIADGISVKEVGHQTFKIIQECVDELVLVEEEEIAVAILLLLEHQKILAEGAGATPLAALLNGSIKVPREGKTVLIISGGNVDSPLLGRMINQGLINRGRVVGIRVRMADIPGSLAKLLSLIAELKANVLHIYHDRSGRGVPIYVTHVELELETRGISHVDEIKKALTEAGYEFRMK
jgi:threonine dehydratase